MKPWPVTAAVRVLRAAAVPFEGFTYDYVERGGTRASAAALGIDEHRIVKTLLFEDDRKQPFLVLMHGDRQVSAKGLARHLGVKSVSPCAPAVAERHSGYRVGGTSPLGTRRRMNVYVERSVLALPEVFVNGGKRGFLVRLDPRELQRLLAAEPVDVAG